MGGGREKGKIETDGPEAGGQGGKRGREIDSGS